MGENLLKLLDTEKHSDWDIVCHDDVEHTFHVHKNIVSASSAFFDRICDSRFSEGLNAQVELPDEHPAIVARAILFMYGARYPTTDIAGGPHLPEYDQFTNVNDPFKDEDFEYSDYYLHRACLHTFMYAFGDKYDMPQLRDYSRYRFLLAFTGNDEHDPGEETSWDGDHIEDEMKGEDNSLWEELAPIIKLVYSSTPSSDRGLRNIVVQCILLRTWWTHLSNVVALPAFRNLLMEMPELQWEMVTMPVSVREYKCMNCKDDDTVLSIAKQCPCGKIGSCRKRECAEAGKKNTFCMSCLSLDCIMLQDEEIDDEVPEAKEGAEDGVKKE